MIEVLFQGFTLLALFLLNPLFLVGLVVIIVIGHFRVKKERSFFKVRLLPELTELKRLLVESWMFGLALSIIICGFILSVDLDWLILFYIISFLALLSFNFKVTSPIYFAVAAFIIIFILDFYGVEMDSLGWHLGEPSHWIESVAMIAVIAGVLLMIEGILIRGYGSRYLSPFFIPTNRGLHGVAFKAKQLWLLPVLFLVPGDLITDFIPKWPVFEFGNSAVLTLVPVPIVIGYAQVFRAAYPDIELPKLGRRVVILGAVTVVMGIVAFWLPILGVLALLIGAIGRAVIDMIGAYRDRKGKILMAPTSQGIVIASILPNSLSEKMGLMPGECIKIVNGDKVNNEQELYKALQINAHYCFLHVISRDGEVRILKQEIYDHDHHLLGILLIR